MTHTPGPWERTNKGASIKAVNGLPGMDDSQLLPVILLGSGLCREANSLLIAAAPELMAACLAIEEWWLREGMHQSWGAPAAMFMVRAAVARAQGAPYGDEHILQFNNHFRNNDE